MNRTSIKKPHNLTVESQYKTAKAGILSKQQTAGETDRHHMCGNGQTEEGS